MKKITALILGVILLFPVTALAGEYNVEVSAMDIVVNTIDIDSLTDQHKEMLIRSVITEEEETKLAKMVYGEDRQNILMERAATIWCAFNRADAWGISIDEVITTNQFHGYFKGQKCPEWARELARDVALRYALEKLGYEDIGRVLPSDYLYFASNEGHNRFRQEYRSGIYWDWSYVDPYEGR